MKRVLQRWVKALAPAGSRRRAFVERCVRTLHAPRYRALGTRPLDLDDAEAVRSFLRAIGHPCRRDWSSLSVAADDIRRLRLICDHHRELWELVPLAFTPAGTRGLLCWLSERQRSLGLCDNSILAFAQELAKDPSRGLADCYLRQPKWQQRVPDGLSLGGWQRLKEWLRRRYHITDSWLDAATLPDCFQRNGAMAVERTRGVNVLAHFCYLSGLREAAVTVVRGLERVGMEVSRRDVPASWKCDTPERDDFLGLEAHEQTLILLAPEPLFADCYARAGLHPRAGVQRVGIWYWELETAPRRWASHARGLSEVWAPTRFIADALRPVLPVPVVPMLPGVDLSPFPPLPRKRFGLPDDRYLFLFAFDMCSVMERKNPLGAIEAFRRAFNSGESVTLAIKVARGEADEEERARLLEAARDAGVTVLDEMLSREGQLALMNCCDCYVSLHRSEGFGLTMAEAMLLGKPVIATGYSGNLDFMNEGNSYLVRHGRARIGRDLPIYGGRGYWAEPDVDHAAALMRRVVERRDEARELGRRARSQLRELLSLRTAGERMARRLAAMRLPSSPGSLHG